MTYRILLCISLISFNSCATVLNKTKYNIRINSTELPAKVNLNDTILDLPASLKILRSKNDLPIELITDSSNREFVLKSSPSPTFVFGNLLWTYLCPAAYLIDLTNQKRFYYGKSILLDINDSITLLQPVYLKKFHSCFEKRYPTAKNQFYLSISLPWINNFYLRPNQESIKSNTGFWGFSVGLDYYYSEKKYFNLSVAAVSDFFIPVPAAVDILGEYELMDSFYGTFTHNHRIGRFRVGYGLDYAINSWNYKYIPDSQLPPAPRENTTKTSLSFGTVATGNYQVGKNFFIGLIYRPSILRLDPNFELKYEHLISFEFGWKIKI